ncbi:unnamed protein product [Didymodactylos carnosus]|uniref:Uncharacterized protein n=1 Tax=Didymodactylos carnosus TaxID=1234261 RepID=A0A815CKL6_9BILA|nr:unnamed protein product [Didymodactylos carnosus]CAF1284921.1 unnamed protein product [Didymodactylos carnosus]CAF3818805.1 unnamed protein product [Didymodactylos carnosus]CAF4084158.1 unnamed protein product [Didymodactylos carnosus]
MVQETAQKICNQYRQSASDGIVKLGLSASSDKISNNIQIACEFDLRYTGEPKYAASAIFSLMANSLSEANPSTEQFQNLTALSSNLIKEAITNAEKKKLQLQLQLKLQLRLQLKLQLRLLQVFFTLRLDLSNNTCTTTWNNPITLLSIINSTAFGYTFYQYSYTATTSQATLAFTLKQDPSFWCLDDISVTWNGVNSIVNSGFENGRSKNGGIPSDLFCNPNNAQAAGRVTAACAHSGTCSYYDGSVRYIDYISQTFSTVQGKQYQI